MSRLVARALVAVAERRGAISVVLSRLFRFGTPLLVALCAVGLVPWWLIVVPVAPVWFSFVTSVHGAYERARLVRRPRRSMTLAESGAERKFRFADAKAKEADAERIDAFRELIRARITGEQEAASVRKRARRARGTRAGGWRGPPAAR